MDSHTQTHIYVHMHAQTWVSTYGQTYIHKNTYTYTHICTHRGTNIKIGPYGHLGTYNHTQCAHTHRLTHAGRYPWTQISLSLLMHFVLDFEDVVQSSAS